LSVTIQAATPQVHDRAQRLEWRYFVGIFLPAILNPRERLKPMGLSTVRAFPLFIGLRLISLTAFVDDPACSGSIAHYGQAIAPKF